MQRRTSTLLMIATCAILLGTAGCGGSRPPTGKRLRLKGAKGAQCTYDRECASNKCLGRRCTEKIDKVGLGGECESDDYCKKGFHCDRPAKKCAPKLKCRKFKSQLRKCLVDVYIAYKPSQARKLRRMGGRAMRRFFRRKRIYGLLYQRLCSRTRGGASYQRSLALIRALKQSDCGKFATYFRKGAG